MSDFKRPDIEALRDAWQEAFPEIELKMETVPLEETMFTFPPEHLVPAARILVEQFDVPHLSTITGDDTGEGVALLYHFWAESGITLRALLPYDVLRIPTLTDLIPGAAFYEREVWELLGVTFEGHPDPEPLLMPDDWEGGHLLRKDEQTKENDDE